MTVQWTDPKPEETRPLSPEQIKAALKRVLASQAFTGSDRMKSFLSYVVAEALAGRQQTIRAKTIAMDVYGYAAGELAAREGVVRVDAGRVLRKLDAYYAEEGASDPVHISLPVGGYAPQFSTAVSATVKPGRTRTLAVGAALVLGAVLLAAVLLSDQAEPLGKQRSAQPEPHVYDVSPARLEAVNLASAGRDLIFPAADASRLQSSFLVFQAAMDRDPLYFGSYAGLAQVETMRAIIAFDPSRDGSALSAADRLSARALEIAPDEPWALSARAWFEFADGSYQSAQTLSARATQIGPDDPHVAEFDALISLYTGQYDRILDRAAKFESLARESGSNVFGNALGAAQFHTGDYASAIETFEASIARGGPFGPIASAYLIAAHWRNGEQDTARRLARTFMKTWPEFPLEAIKRRVFAERAPADDLLAAMSAAGWSQSGGGAVQ